MRVSNVLCALLIPAYAAAADKPPRLKAGEWQYVQLSDHGLGFDDAGTTCLADQSALSKFDTIPNCSRKESHTDGTITIADAQCRVPDHALSVHEKIMRLDDNNFYIYLRAIYSPPVLQGTEIEQREAMHFTHAKWLGPCPKGQIPHTFF